MSDSSTPLMGMRVAADGSITYDFDGTVHATGLTLEERVSSDPENTIEWLQEGIVREGIYGSRLTEKSKIRTLILFAGNLASALGQVRLELIGTDAASSGSAPSIIARIGRDAEGNNEAAALILDYLGRSSFLQVLEGGVPEPKRRGVDFGTVKVEFKGGTVSGLTKVKHDLGATPKAVVLAQQGFELGMLFARSQNLTETEFEVAGCSPLGGVTGPATFAWIAIG